MDGGSSASGSGQWSRQDSVVIRPATEDEQVACEFLFTTQETQNRMPALAFMIELPMAIV